MPKPHAHDTAANEGLSEAGAYEHNLAVMDEARREHAEFKAHFARGECHICGDAITSFDERKPCVHWLLRPQGMKKRHFPAIAEKFGMMQTQSWIRWVANEGAYAMNITDASDEEGWIVRLTARYGDFEWSFSCDKNDFAGHQGKASNYPHFHFQMRINGKPFISYNDFHAPILRWEAEQLRAIHADGSRIKSKFIYGEGIEDVMDNLGPEAIVNLPIVKDGDPDKAPFRIQTMWIAEEGKTISGDDLADLFSKARRDGVTVASLAHHLPNASVRTLVEPGPGVVDPAPREGGRAARRRD